MKIIESRENQSFLRRIKRHVVGPEHRFAVITPPELAPICLKEIVGLGIQNAEVTEAGVEFTGKLTAAYECNMKSRTATRVLCRLPQFRAGTREELFFKVSQVPWELWLNPEIPLEVQAQVAYSRISHEGETAYTLFRGIERGFRDRMPSAQPVSQYVPTGEDERGRTDLKQRILIRLIKNHCEISLDTTGSHLHERGYRLHHMGAPLRETLAAGILMKLDWNGEMPLIDGMCGSGTFPIEAAMIARDVPPGIGREFLFERWPSFQKGTWEFLCRSAKEVTSGNVPTIIGIDNDPEAVRVSNENAVRAGFGNEIEWKEMDFFEFDPMDRKLKNGLVVLNPPYGKRLDGGGKAFYERIGSQLRRFYRGWKYAVLAATRSEASAMGFKSTRFWTIRHGGIPVSVAMGRVG